LGVGGKGLLGVVVHFISSGVLPTKFRILHVLFALSHIISNLSDDSPPIMLRLDIIRLDTVLLDNLRLDILRFLDIRLRLDIRLERLDIRLFEEARLLFLLYIL
jgi:hypothetical protein